MRHKENYRIRSSECDEKDIIRLAPLWDIMQDAANEQARLIGAAFEDMHAKGMAWALIRMEAKIDRYPKYGESIDVVTYPAGYSKLYAIRHYHIIDGEGHEIAFANSTWIVVDKKNKRPQRVGKFFANIFHDEYTGKLCSKLEEAPELEYKRDIVAEYSDIDPNRHVNNARYINWVENEFAGRRINYINANYINETKLGTSIEVWTSKGDIELRTKDGKPLFRGKLLLD